MTAHLEFHGEVLLGHSEHSDGSFRLAELVVDGNESLHRRLRVRYELLLLIVQCLSKGVTLFRQGTQRPAPIKLWSLQADFTWTKHHTTGRVHMDKASHRLEHDDKKSVSATPCRMDEKGRV